MLPIYFFAIVLSAISGLIFCILDAKSASSKVHRVSDVNETLLPFLRQSNVLLVATIACVLVGLLKIFYPVKNADNVSVFLFGDSLSMLALLVAACYYGIRFISLTDGDEKLPHFFAVVRPYEFYAGIFCLVAGVLHLLFAGALFL